MQTMSMRIFLVLFVLFLINPSLLNATTERRTALVIGNGSYEMGPLRNPVTDAADVAEALKRLGFNVTLHQNANQRTMEDAIREFGRNLKKERGVGLFYYAGHGMQIGGVNYLIPLGARVEKEIDVKFQAVNAEMILAEMEYAENAMNIVVLDACRDNPFRRSFRSTSRGLAIISNAPTGTFISFSTGANQLAKDGEGRNSPYTKALLANIEKPGLTISDVFMEVRKSVFRETGQTPWELSSLIGHYYFNPGDLTKTARMTGTSTADLNEGQRKIEDEKDRLRREKELLEQKRTLEEERRKLEEEKQQLAMARPAVTGPREIKRDGRFIAYEDGTVLDSSTNLMWAARDNGSSINWNDAKTYCANYNGGGYTDWRMPTQDELMGLYNRGIRSSSNKGLIKVTSFCVWASEIDGSAADPIHFGAGVSTWTPRFFSNLYRALPVRSAK
jgi:hypothetical protein